MSWATRRKATYASFFVIAVTAIVVVPAFLLLYKAPTCFDGFKNGSETGIDCGGSCTRICDSEFIPPHILWARSQKVAQGLYNIGAYVENPNLLGSVTNFPYLFRLYDANGLLITERRGATYLPAHKNILVFESAVQTRERIPSRITFEFTSALQWSKKSDNNQYIQVLSKTATGDTGTPKLEVALQNSSALSLDGIDVAAILYNADDTTVGFSRTRIDTLYAGQSDTAVFTWPLPFTSDITRIEIIPTIHP